ncbi:MAG: L,D-transpeptidase family protein [Alphaproteobacteria bacterium]|nr:L,D-transpeptidase family protein [Alphaproteobacteria bacterium]
MKLLKSLLLLACIIFPLAVPVWGKASASSNPAIEKLLKAGSKAIGATVDIALLSDFYGRRNYTTAWQLHESSAKTTVKEFAAFVHTTLEEHGLGDRGYPFHALEERVNIGTDEALAQADIIASDIVLRMARSLSGQDPIPRSKLHTWPLSRDKTDIAGGLNKAINDGRVPEYLEHLAPQVKAYAKLKEALKLYREIADKGGWTRVKSGGVIQEGFDDDRLLQIHNRLAQEGFMPFPNSPAPVKTYSPALVEGMKQFQETHGLYPDGNIGPETFRAMNVTARERIDQIRVNLARIRQSPPDAWEDIVINIPSAQLSYYRHGEVVYEAPVVVGRVDRPSPLVKSAIYEMIINPSWYVPSSIAEKDLLPKWEKDPEFLEKQGIHHRGGGGDGMLRQDPGPLNSLGRIKFNFQNPFAVYLHGTPHQELFGKDDRTRSSGCIRLKDPAELALIFMKNNPDWTPDRLQKRIDSMKTQRVTPPEKTPIKLLYWSAIVDSKDRVQFFNDVYGLDAEWAKLL